MAEQRVYLECPILDQLCKGMSDLRKIDAASLLSALQRAVEDDLPLTAVIHFDRIDVIHKIYELFVGCSSVDPSLVKIVHISSMNSWKGRLFENSAENWTDMVYQRCSPQEHHEYVRGEFMLRHLHEAGILQVGFCTYGAMFGENGLDYSSFLRFLWTGQQIQVPDELKDVVPLGTNVQRAQELLLQTILQDRSTHSHVRALFDVQATTVEKLVDDLVLRCPRFDSENTMRVDPFEIFRNSINSSWMTRWSKHLPQNSLITEFDNIWSSFRAENGLLPVRLLVAGPPKSGKTNIATQIAGWLSVPIITVYSSVQFCFGPIALDSDGELSAVRKEVCSEVEEKYLESLAATKKGKDKTPVDTKFDISLIDEAFCAGLPLTVQARSMLLRIHIDPLCRAKGFVVDFTTIELAATVAQCSVDLTNTFPFDVAVVVESSKTEIMSKVSDSLGPQQAKSKEGQAQLKALESSLDSYFSVITAEAALPLSLQEWESSGKLQIAKIGAFQDDPSSFHNLILTAIRQHCGFSPGWLNHEVDASFNDVVDVVDVVDPVTSDKQKLDGPHNSFDCENVSEDVMFQNDSSTIQYEEFLGATLLPSLAEAMVAVIRGHHDDPIKSLATLLIEKSAHLKDIAKNTAESEFRYRLQHL